MINRHRCVWLRAVSDLPLELDVGWRRDIWLSEQQCTLFRLEIIAHSDNTHNTRPRTRSNSGSSEDQPGRVSVVFCSLSSFDCTDGYLSLFLAMYLSTPSMFPCSLTSLSAVCGPTPLMLTV